MFASRIARLALHAVRVPYAALTLLFLYDCLTAAAQPQKINFQFTEEPVSADGPEVVVLGTVFEDVDGDGKFTAGADAPVPGVGVSDGVSVTASDPQGRYLLRTSAEAEFVFITQPANYVRTKDFFALLPKEETETTPTAEAVSAPRQPRRLGVDFPLKRTAQPDDAQIRFVQISDPALRGEEDRGRFRQVVQEMDALAPKPTFVVTTGFVSESRQPGVPHRIYAEETGKSGIPWFHAPGDSGAPDAESLIAPPCYSADYPGVHLVFLSGGAAEAKGRAAWLERDVRLLGRDKQVYAFLGSQPDASLLQVLRKLGVKVILYGGEYVSSIHGFKDGTTLIGQSPVLMGGVDGSPAGFRIVAALGNQLMSEFRVRGVRQLLAFPYPQGDLSAQPRLMANLYDTVGEAAEARFRLAVPQGPLAEGEMKRVGPLTWMGSLDPKDFEVKELPADFVAVVRVRGHDGKTWENGMKIHVPQGRRERAAKIKPGADWMQFLGSGQRTGAAEDEVLPPFRMAWATPTHGSIDFSSPVYYHGRVAIGVKDRDNLINNGMAIFTAETGELAHFAKLDAMVNGTPAFAPDPAGEAGRLYVMTGTGSVYYIHPGSGKNQGQSLWAQDSLQWLGGSPLVDRGLAVVGGPGRTTGLDALFASQRWVTTAGAGTRPSQTAAAAVRNLIVFGGLGAEEGGRSSGIYALDRQTGQAAWNNPTSGIGGSIAVRDDKGFAIDVEGRLKVLDLRTGRDLAKLDLGGQYALSSPAIDSDVLVVPTALGTVDAFDTGTLRRRWSFRGQESLWIQAPLSREKTPVFSSPTISGSLVYIGCSDGNLYALDKATGEVRWSYNFGVPTLSAPCVTGNALFTAACDGNVYAFVGQAGGGEKD